MIDKHLRPRGTANVQVFIVRLRGAHLSAKSGLCKTRVVRIRQELRDHGVRQSQNSASNIGAAGRQCERNTYVMTVEWESAKQHAWEVVTDAAL